MALSYDIFIIGANRGIGFELTRRLSANGHNVFASYRPQSRDDDSVAKLAKIAKKSFEVDFTEEASIAAAAKSFGDHKLDILINCAGVYYLWDDKPFTEMSADDFLWFFKVNTLGPILASKHFLPALSKGEAGRIVNISSDFASIEDNDGGNAVYKVSKAALNQFTKGAGMELQKLGTNVQTLAVHPGFVPTRMTGYVGDNDLDECMEELVDVIECFASKDGKANLKNGGYVNWKGETMRF
ncbi:MAG: hypothetical protein Q9160_003225 [Pyrenula sp. 1 TL-2023]